MTLDFKGDSCGKIAKSLVEIARKNELSIVEVNNAYTVFNKTVYIDYFNQGGQFSMYVSELEEKALKLTEIYFNVRKPKDFDIEKLKSLKN